MGLKRIKISELTLSDNLEGLYTIGVKLIDGVQTSVKVSLEYIQTAYDNVVAATKKANTAAALANEKATAADTAAGRVSDAIEKANTSATTATEKAAAAENASGEATGKIADMNAALARLEELEQTLTAQTRQQPTAMALDYPRKITKGNKDILKIAAMLSPAGTGSNVLFLGDDKAVTVAPNGFLIVNEVGKSKIHVIPTENTSIYRTIEIEVIPVSARLHTKTALRLTANGNFRLS